MSIFAQNNFKQGTGVHNRFNYNGIKSLNAAVGNINPIHHDKYKSFSVSKWTGVSVHESSPYLNMGVYSNAGNSGYPHRENNVPNHINRNADQANALFGNRGAYGISQVPVIKKFQNSSTKGLRRTYPQHLSSGDYAK